MFLVKKNMLVKKVVMEEDKAEVLKIGIRMEEGKRDFTMVYVPFKTNAWKKEEKDEILSDTIMSLKKILEESDNIIMLDDFNCKKVCWNL